MAGMIARPPWQRMGATPLARLGHEAAATGPLKRVPAYRPAAWARSRAASRCASGVACAKKRFNPGQR